MQMIGDLIGEWRDIVDITARASEFDAAKAATVYGYTAHCHRLAPIALDLLEYRLVIEAQPLVRAVFETAVHAMWIAQVPDAMPAALREEWRQRKNILVTLNDAPTFRDHDLSKVDRLDGWGQQTVTGSARRFDEVCNDLDLAGADAYANYRLLSAFCHPSVLLADLYIAPATDASPFQLRPEPDEPPGVVSLYLLAASLVWSGRALDFFDRGRPRRNALRVRAGRLGIPDVLRLSESAWLRQLGH